VKVALLPSVGVQAQLKLVDSIQKDEQTSEDLDNEDGNNFVSTILSKLVSLPFKLLQNFLTLPIEKPQGATPLSFLGLLKIVL